MSKLGFMPTLILHIIFIRNGISKAISEKSDFTYFKKRLSNFTQRITCFKKWAFI